MTQDESCGLLEWLRDLGGSQFKLLPRWQAAVVESTTVLFDIGFPAAEAPRLAGRAIFHGLCLIACHYLPT